VSKTKISRDLSKQNGDDERMNQSDRQLALCALGPITSQRVSHFAE